MSISVSICQSYGMWFKTSSIRWKQPAENFRSLLIAAATVAPDDPSQAAKRVWDHYYCNHQKVGHFRKLRVLDIFMGGGTTLVEGARLGFQMAGVDLNPVAWFVTKNELACSDPAQVKALFEDIEAKVKPLVQPFYTTTCPRGHTGRWFRVTGSEFRVEKAEQHKIPNQKPETVNQELQPVLEQDAQDRKL